MPADIVNAEDKDPESVLVPASIIPLEILSSEEVLANLTSEFKVSVPKPDLVNLKKSSPAVVLIVCAPAPLKLIVEVASVKPAVP